MAPGGGGVHSIAVFNTAVWQGELRAPLNPQLFAPLAERRAGGARRPPDPVAGAPVAERRPVMVAARVTPAEHAAWQDKAAVAGLSPSALLRQAMARPRSTSRRISTTFRFSPLGEYSTGMRS